MRILCIPYLPLLTKFPAHFNHLDFTVLTVLGVLHNLGCYLLCNILNYSLFSSFLCPDISLSILLAYHCEHINENTRMRASTLNSKKYSGSVKGRLFLRELRRAVLYEFG
jgi:hypothetical protein